jgi:hypothetical protein
MGLRFLVVPFTIAEVESMGQEEHVTEADLAWAEETVRGHPSVSLLLYSTHLLPFLSPCTYV